MPLGNPAHDGSTISDDARYMLAALLQGDITVKLFPDECPKTVENFTTHAQNG